MNNAFEKNYNVRGAIATMDISQIGDMNPFFAPGIQGNAMLNTLQGGIPQQGSARIVRSYDGVGDVEFALDLYRVLAKNNISGQVGGDLRAGSFEGTVTVGSDGMVSYFVTEPSSNIIIDFAAGALVLRRRRPSA